MPAPIACPQTALPRMGASSTVGFASPAPVKTAPNAAAPPLVVGGGKC